MWISQTLWEKAYSCMWHYPKRSNYDLLSLKNSLIRLLIRWLGNNHRIILIKAFSNDANKTNLRVCRVSHEIKKAYKST
jgi:hypothetical protein